MRASLTVLIALGFVATPSAQGLSQNDAYLIREMLRNAYETVKAHYYDPAFHGVDLDARYRDFSDRLKAATSVDAGEVVVAQFLEGLKDSHTFFQPPARSFQVDYGYQLDLVGNDAFVTHVHAGTDAAARLTPGDRVISINGLPIDRESDYTVRYILTVLAPRTSTELVVESPGGDLRTVMVASTVHQKRIARSLTNGNEISAVNQERDDALRSLRQQHVEMGAVMIWKMPAFFAEDAEIDRLFSEARKHAGLVLDLRGNPGGRVDTLVRMVGNLFDRDVAVATRMARADQKKVVAPTRGRVAYAGKVVVLIDSRSASAAEVLSRVIQLEHRGTVIGDRSAGAVMEAIGYPFRLGNDALLYYAFSVTDADVIMTDGHSLERAGVTPDETRLPSPRDLAAGRDPVLSYAAHLAGLELDPVAAGKLFPFEWPVR
ncbi:MAG TPA: S41 family peptidase [Vicinamibacterales bacterium]|nr:S41 family peptidase [Vicinamibacterales bacterium]